MYDPDDLDDFESEEDEEGWESLAEYYLDR